MTAWTELLHFRKLGKVSPAFQIGLIVALFVFTTWVGYLDFQRTGLLFGFPLRTSILFVPIYEELIFRGAIFGSLFQQRSFSKHSFGPASYSDSGISKMSSFFPRGNFCGKCSMQP